MEDNIVPEQLIIGIDLGGTKISTALADSAGKIIAHDYRQTHAAEGLDAVIERMLDAARRVMAQGEVESTEITAVGIGAPGPVDVEAGILVAPPNLPGWDRVSLKQLIEAELGITTFMDNDANAGALGEHRFGAGRGTRHMIYVTVSTGIGGGLILDGRLYYGADGMAGEIGHITIVPHGPLCGCGNRGCLEILSSGTSIAREARERVARGVPTLMADLAEGNLERITAKLVAQAAGQGDAEAQHILTEAMNYLGIGMATLVNLFNPQLIVIGGGVTNIGEMLFGPVRRAIDRHAFRTSAQAVRVVRAELGDNAGVLGAVAVALVQMQNET
jgi:glucokinase